MIKKSSTEVLEESKKVLFQRKVNDIPLPFLAVMHWGFMLW